jgi:hypothetical protein
MLYLYNLVSGHTIDLLKHNVGESMKDGYICQGGVVYIEGGTGVYPYGCFFQAMVLAPQFRDAKNIKELRELIKGSNIRLEN